ncbi:MAG: hypothetical protein R6U39_03155 [Candidatus Aegiribacteria sp.]
MISFPSVEKRALLHVHTRASDGTGTMEEVMAEAVAAGADILGINDHRTLWARDNGYGGWNSSLFVLAGTELEDSARKSHILAWGIDGLPPSADTSEQIEFVNRRGGVAIAAHPTEAPGKLPRTGSYAWTADSTEGLAGVEVWNYMSLWKRNISLLNMRMKLKHPDDSVEHPDPAAIEFWRNVGGCAIAGPDAHALKFGPGRRKLVVFPYPMLFRRLLTHILLEEELPGDDALAERRILDALKRGSCFTSNAILGDARGFRAAREDGRVAVRLPSGGEVAVFGSQGGMWTGRLGPGEHRMDQAVEGPLSIHVYRKGRTWICCGLP